MFDRFSIDFRQIFAEGGSVHDGQIEPSSTPDTPPDLQKIYRKSIEHLSKIYRTSIENLSKIDRKSIENRSNPQTMHFLTFLTKITKQMNEIQYGRGVIQY